MEQKETRSYKDANDYELMYLIREQSEDAFLTIYEKYRPVIERIATKWEARLKSRRVALDDLIQEGYIGLEHAVRYYEEERGPLFYTFACVCIERRMLTSLRPILKDSHIPETVIFSLEGMIRNTTLPLEETIVDPKQLPLDRLMLDESLEAVVRFKSCLEEFDACVFELRSNGFTYKEIAALLDISLAKVRLSVTRVRSQLRQSNCRSHFSPN